MRLGTKVIGLLGAAALGACSVGTPLEPEADQSDAGPLAGASVLVFSKTAGWRHDSIEAGQDMFRGLSDAHGFEAVFTEDAATFTDESLSGFAAIVFLNTTGDVLDDTQEDAMERYIQGGGGFVGIHAATDTETEGWPWFVGLSGGAFAGHPEWPNNVQFADFSVADAAHPATKGLPANFQFEDEWYDIKDFNEDTSPLLMIDRDSYTGAKDSGLQPIAWHHDYDGGRAFYTNLGHKKATFQDELFLSHVIGGLAYAIGASE